jgi:hypothetical protein
MYGSAKLYTGDTQKEAGEQNNASGEEKQTHALQRGIPAFINNEMLREIRGNTDWREVFYALGLEQDPRKSKEDDFWALSPLSDEETASFHINAHGWYCHSTGQGGGNIELIQKVMHRLTGIAMNCFEAGRWLLERGVSPIPTRPPAPSGPHRALPARRVTEHRKAGDAQGTGDGRRRRKK